MDITNKQNIKNLLRNYKTLNIFCTVEILIILLLITVETNYSYNIVEELIHFTTLILLLILIISSIVTVMKYIKTKNILEAVKDIETSKESDNKIVALSLLTMLKQLKQIKILRLSAEWIAFIPVILLISSKEFNISSIIALILFDTIVILAVYLPIKTLINTKILDINTLKVKLK